MTRKRGSHRRSRNGSKRIEVSRVFQSEFLFASLVVIFDAFDDGAERTQFHVKIFITPFDEVDIVNGRKAVGDETRKDKSGACAQIRRDDVCARVRSTLAKLDDFTALLSVDCPTVRREAA